MCVCVVIVVVIVNFQQRNLSPLHLYKLSSKTCLAFVRVSGFRQQGMIDTVLQYSRVARV